MNAYECVSCGTLWDTPFFEQWGTSRESDGYGALPKCTNLVPGSALTGAPNPMLWCGGALIATATEEPELIRTVLPIRVSTGVTDGIQDQLDELLQRLEEAEVLIHQLKKKGKK